MTDATGITDAERAERMMLGLGADLETVRMVVVPGPPKSKARPRHGRGNTYAPDSPAQTDLAFQMKLRLGNWDGNVALGAAFLRPNFQRIDVDNMLKLVLDAGTQAGIWLDDSQVTGLLGTIDLDRNQPRTVIVIGHHVSSLDRSRPTRVCSHCGESFTVVYPGQRQKFCSRRCHGLAFTQPKVHPGQGRGAKGQPPAFCIECGGALSKRSYIHCRPCFLKERESRRHERNPHGELRV